MGGPVRRRVSMSDYYSVLNLEKDASEDDIKRSYKILARKWHPDKNPANQEEANKKFKEISEAYQTLSNADKRIDYDEKQTENEYEQEEEEEYDEEEGVPTFSFGSGRSFSFGHFTSFSFQSSMFQDVFGFSQGGDDDEEEGEDSDEPDEADEEEDSDEENYEDTDLDPRFN